MDGEFLCHGPCPNCGSRDNLGIYTDHVYCFGCGYFRRTPVSREVMDSRLRRKNVAVSVVGELSSTPESLDFPADFTYNIPATGFDWLSQYKLTVNEIRGNNIGWSDEGYKSIAPLLIFPVFSPDGELYMWQGRYFGSDPKAPKYITRGGKDHIHLLGGQHLQDQKPVILVEDVISCIKVARRFPSICLFGSNIGGKLISRLPHITRSVGIWLDMDKYRQALQFQKKLEQVLDNVFVVQSVMDPKCYSTAEIQQFIDGVG